MTCKIPPFEGWGWVRLGAGGSGSKWGEEWVGGGGGGGWGS